jgi:hypothetical protein
VFCLRAINPLTLVFHQTTRVWDPLHSLHHLLLNSLFSPSWFSFCSPEYQIQPQNEALRRGLHQRSWRWWQCSSSVVWWGGRAPVERFRGAAKHSRRRHPRGEAHHHTATSSGDPGWGIVGSCINVGTPPWASFIPYRSGDGELPVGSGGEVVSPSASRLLRCSFFCKFLCKTFLKNICFWIFKKLRFNFLQDLCDYIF